MSTAESKFRNDSEDWITITSKKLDPKKKVSIIPQTTAPSISSVSHTAVGSRETPKGKEPQFCRFFQLGQCTKGNKCPFLHKKAPPHFSSELCKFFANGNCKNGERCPFSHDVSAFPPVTTEKKNAVKIPASLPHVPRAASGGGSGSLSGPVSPRSASSKPIPEAKPATSPSELDSAGGEVVWRPVSHSNVSKSNMPEKVVVTPPTTPRATDSGQRSKSSSQEASPTLLPESKLVIKELHTPGSSPQTDILHLTAPSLLPSDGSLPNSHHSSASMSTQSTPSTSPEFQHAERILSSLASGIGSIFAPPNQQPSFPTSAPTSQQSQKSSRRSSQQFDLQGMFESLLGGDGGEFKDVSLLMDVEEEDEEPTEDDEDIKSSQDAQERADSLSDLPPIMRGVATPSKSRRLSAPESEFSFAGMFTSSSPIPIGGAHIESIFDGTAAATASAAAAKKPAPLLARKSFDDVFSSASSHSSKNRTHSFGNAPAPILSPPTAPLGLAAISASGKYSPQTPKKSVSSAPVTPPALSPRALTGSRTVPRTASPVQSSAVAHFNMDQWSHSLDMSDDDDFNPIPSHHNIRPQQPQPSWERPRMSSTSSISPVETAGDLSMSYQAQPAAPSVSSPRHLQKSSPILSHSPPASSFTPPPSGSVEKKRQLCMYFLEGGCRFGDYCKFIHGDLCTICKKPYLFPDDHQQNEKHLQQCMKEKEREDARDLVCTICRKKVVDLGRKFGIMPQCTCVFCITCIKDHRTNNNESECPRCGAPSPFMVPSYGYPREQSRKSQLLNNYMEKMRKIPCKYFDNGKGACRFGSACHYAHVDDNGLEVVPQQLRSYVDSSGGYTQHQEINLGMFFQKAERRKH